MLGVFQQSIEIGKAQNPYWFTEYKYESSE